MDIDPSSSKFWHPTNFRQGNNTQYQSSQAPKRPNSSERRTGQRRRRVNNVEQTASAEELNAIDDGSGSFDCNDLVNFLEEGPAWPFLSERWRGELWKYNNSGKELCKAPKGAQEHNACWLPIYCKFRSWLQYGKRKVLNAHIRAKGSIFFPWYHLDDWCHNRFRLANAGRSGIKST